MCSLIVIGIVSFIEWQSRIREIVNGWPTNVGDAIKLFGESDMGSYLAGAMAIKTNTFQTQRYILVNPPPGVPLLERWLLELTHNLHSLAFLYFIFVVASMLCMQWQIVRLASISKNHYWRNFFAISLLPGYMLFSDFRIRFLDVSIFMSDQFGVFLGFTSLLFLIRFFIEKKIWNLAFFATFGTFAGFFRTMWFNTTIGISVFTIAFVLYSDRKQSKFLTFRKNQKIIAIGLLLPFLITLPWRATVHNQFGVSYLDWSQENKLVFTYQWSDYSEWKGSFLKNTGAYGICHILPSDCRKLEPVAKSIGSHPENRNYLATETIKAWVFHSIPLTIYEIPFILKGIFSPPGTYTPGLAFHFSPFLLFFTALVVMMVWHMIKYKNAIGIVGILTLTALQIIPLILVHTENRYVLPVFFVPILYFAGLINFCKYPVFRARQKC